MSNLRLYSLLLALVNSAKPKDDKIFSLIISTLVEERVFFVHELADSLRVSLPSIDRWARGRNLPTKNIRKGIYRYLRKELEHLIELDKKS